MYKCSDSSLELIAIVEGIEPFFPPGRLIDRKPSSSLLRDASKFSNLQEGKLALASLEQKLVESRKRDRLTIDLMATIRALMVRIDWKLVTTQQFSTYLDNLFGSVRPVSSQTIRRNTKQLNMLLSDAGYAEGWPTNLQKWKEENTCSAQEFAAQIEASAATGLQISKAHILPEILSPSQQTAFLERLSFSVEAEQSDEMWSAYCDYEGDLHSKITINSSFSNIKSSSFLFSLHELFPGHSLESSLKDFLFLDGSLDIFYNLHILGVPRSMYTEGLADFLPYYFFKMASPDEKIGFLEDKIFTDYRHNIALRYVTGEISLDAAAQELSTSTTANIERCNRALNFASSWESYFPTYSQGFYVVQKLFQHGNIDWTALYTRCDIG